MAADLTNGLFTLAGAVLGAMITGGIAWYVSRQNRTRSELTVLKGVTVSLVEVRPDVSSVVELRVRGEVVPTVYTQDIRILNTGTDVIKDGKISFIAVDAAQVLSADILGFASSAADALKACTNDQKDSATVTFKYVNSGEEFLLRILLDQRISVEPKFRQSGVNFVVRNYSESTLPIALEMLTASSLLNFLAWLLVPPYRSWYNLREIKRLSGKLRSERDG